MGVRTIPRSRTDPQSDRDTLPEALAGLQIGWAQVAARCGRRGKPRGAGPSPDGCRRVVSFPHHADHALTPALGGGRAQLRGPGARRRCAVICAEGLWWRCYCRIIANWLLAAREAVRHILGLGHVEVASPTPGGVEDGCGRMTRPAPG